MFYQDWPTTSTVPVVSHVRLHPFLQIKKIGMTLAIICNIAVILWRSI
jgi:hypothetical protein